MIDRSGELDALLTWHLTNMDEASLICYLEIQYSTFDPFLLLNDRSVQSLNLVTCRDGRVVEGCRLFFCETASAVLTPAGGLGGVGSQAWRRDRAKTYGAKSGYAAMTHAQRQDLRKTRWEARLLELLAESNRSDQELSEGSKFPERKPVISKILKEELAVNSQWITDRLERETRVRYGSISPE
jgi:hypothetical protein